MSDEEEDLICKGCSEAYALRDGCEPVEFCDACAHEEIERLRNALAAAQNDAAQMRAERDEAIGDEHRASQARNEMARALHRLQHGAAIEGDCVCEHEVALSATRAERDEARREREEARAEIVEALRMAYALTLDCQTIGEAVADLVRITREARSQRDAALARALAAEAEAERLRGVVERARKVADAFTDVVVNADDTESQWCDGCGTAGGCESGCPFDALRVALSSLTAAGER